MDRIQWFDYLVLEQKQRIITHFVNQIRTHRVFALVLCVTGCLRGKWQRLAIIFNHKSYTHNDIRKKIEMSKSKSEQNNLTQRNDNRYHLPHKKTHKKKCFACRNGIFRLWMIRMIPVQPNTQIKVT